MQVSDLVFYGYLGRPFGVADHRYVLGITLQPSGRIHECRVFSYPELTPGRRLADYRGRPVPRQWEPVPGLNESHIDEGL